MKGDKIAFDKWHEDNKEKWYEFTDWFSENKINTTKENNFYREIYQ